MADSLGRVTTTELQRRGGKRGRSSVETACIVPRCCTRSSQKPTPCPAAGTKIYDDGLAPAHRQTSQTGEPSRRAKPEKSVGGFVFCSVLFWWRSSWRQPPLAAALPYAIPTSKATSFLVSPSSVFLIRPSTRINPTSSPSLAQNDPAPKPSCLFQPGVVIASIYFCTSQVSTAPAPRDATYLVPTTPQPIWKIHCRSILTLPTTLGTLNLQPFPFSPRL